MLCQSRHSIRSAYDRFQIEIWCHLIFTVFLQFFWINLIRYHHYRLHRFHYFMNYVPNSIGSHTSVCKLICKNFAKRQREKRRKTTWSFRLAKFKITPTAIASGLIAKRKPTSQLLRWQPKCKRNVCEMKSTRNACGLYLMSSENNFVQLGQTSDMKNLNTDTHTHTSRSKQPSNRAKKLQYCIEIIIIEKENKQINE